MLHAVIEYERYIVHVRGRVASDGIAAGVTDKSAERRALLYGRMPGFVRTAAGNISVGPLEVFEGTVSERAENHAGENRAAHTIPTAVILGNIVTEVLWRHSQGIGSSGKIEERGCT